MKPVSCFSLWCWWFGQTHFQIMWSNADLNSVFSYLSKHLYQIVSFRSLCHYFTMALIFDAQSIPVCRDNSSTGPGVLCSKMCLVSSKTWHHNEWLQPHGSCQWLLSLVSAKGKHKLTIILLLLSKYFSITIHLFIY